MSQNETEQDKAQNEKEQNNTWWEKNKDILIGSILFSIFIIAILYLWFPYANDIGTHRRIQPNHY